MANGRGSRNSFIFMIIMEGPGLRRWTVRLDLFHLNGSSLHKDGWILLVKARAAMLVFPLCLQPG